MHEYGLYTDAAKDALRNRDNAQMDYEVHMEQLCRVKAEQTQVQSKASKIYKSLLLYRFLVNYYSLKQLH